MLARGYVSKATGENLNYVKHYDFNNQVEIQQLTVSDFRKMEYKQRVELYQKYPSVYKRLSAAEKGASHGGYTG